MLAPAIAGHKAHAPTDKRFSYDDRSSQTSSIPFSLGFRAAFIAKVQAEYHTLDMRHVPRIQPLQFVPSTDRTVATRLFNTFDTQRSFRYL